MFIMITLNTKPFGSQVMPMKIMSKVLHGERPEIPDQLTNANQKIVPMYLKVMKSCWASNPAERPPFSTLIIEMEEIIMHNLNSTA